MRKYPPLGWLIRKSCADYPIPNSDKMIKAGVKVLIPSWSIHHDRKNYPDPERFDPERFYGTNADNIRCGTFIPFGDGPRNCIGKLTASPKSETNITNKILSKIKIQV